MASRSDRSVPIVISAHAILASARLQWRTIRKAPEHLSTLVTTPLWTALYVSLSPDSPFAAFGAALIGIWQITVGVAAGVIENEKWQGTLELAFGAALPYWCVLFGRIVGFSPLFLLVSAEALLTNLLLTGHLPALHEPLLAANALLLASIGSLGSAVLLGPLFLLVRNGPVISTALTYPILLLGGIAIPAAALPWGLAPVSRVFFLSWVTQLIRHAQSGSQPPTGLLASSWLAVLALSTASTACGVAILARTEGVMLRRGAKEFVS